MEQHTEYRADRRAVKCRVLWELALVYQGRQGADAGSSAIYRLERESLAVYGLLGLMSSPNFTGVRNQME